MYELYTEFLRLDRAYHRPPQHNPGNDGNYVVLRGQFIAAHVAMFHLAQAICQLAAPDVQKELDEARRAVMFELTRCPQGLEVQMSTHAAPAPRWAEHEITPEVSFDHTLTGNPVSKKVAMRLYRAHKAQVATVQRLVQNYRRFHGKAISTDQR